MEDWTNLFSYVSGKGSMPCSRTVSLHLPLMETMLINVLARVTEHFYTWCFAWYQLYLAGRLLWFPSRKLRGTFVKLELAEKPSISSLCYTFHAALYILYRAIAWFLLWSQLAKLPAIFSNTHKCPSFKCVHFFYKYFEGKLFFFSSSRSITAAWSPECVKCIFSIAAVPLGPMDYKGIWWP